MENYSNKDLQKNSFRDQQLASADFSGSDLRGTDFSGADLRLANFSHARTGITQRIKVGVFACAFVISVFSGYVSTHAGHTVEAMLSSDQQRIRYAGIASLVIIGIFILHSIWKGPGNAIYKFILPALATALAVGLISHFSGAGNGIAILYLIAALLLAVIMFLTAIVAKTAIGSLSSILYTIVAITGGIFAKSGGGGIAALIMAIATMLVCRRTSKGIAGFQHFQKINFFLTRKFGTSFRNCKLQGATFTGSRLQNCDFSNADVSFSNEEKIQKLNCIL